MAVALGVLPVREEALRGDEGKIVKCPRHSDIEQAAFLFEFRGRAGTKIRGDAAVNDIEHEHGPPFLTPCGMDCREDQVVLVEQGNTGLVARGVGGIERQFGEEALAARITASDLLELDKVGLAGVGIVMDAIEMWLVPMTREAEFARPSALGFAKSLK